MADNLAKKITAWTIVKGFLGILAAGMTFYGIDQYIEHKVETRMKDLAFIREIASHVRPSLIFDASGSILVDMGAMQYIEKIQVEPAADSPVPKRVIVVPKQYLVYPPLLTTPDPIQFVVTPKRDAGISWEYTFDLGGYYGGVKKARFRLEVIQ